MLIRESKSNFTHYCNCGRQDNLAHSRNLCQNLCYKSDDDTGSKCGEANCDWGKVDCPYCKEIEKPKKKRGRPKKLRIESQGEIEL